MEQLLLFDATVGNVVSFMVVAGIVSIMIPLLRNWMARFVSHNCVGDTVNVFDYIMWGIGITFFVAAGFFYVKFM